MICWKYKKPQIAKAIFKKKNGIGEINSPDFRLLLQSYSHQESMVLIQRQKYRPMGQIETAEINPSTYGHLIFDKGGKNKMEKRQSL